MFDTVDEITTAIKDKEGELTSLHTRMKEHYDLWALEKYVPKDPAGKAREGYESFTSSAPRNFFDKVLDGLNRAALTLRIELPETASPEDKRAASKGELYLFGALAEIDRLLAKRGEPPLREGLGFYMCLRGWYALRALVYVPQKGAEAVFDVQPWDPLQVTWEVGSGGLLWAARKRKASKGQILSEYKLTFEGKDAEVIDFWDEERNSVIVGSEFGKAPMKHRLGHVPILIGAIGSMPTLQGDDTLEKRGDSVYSASEGIYEPINKFASWVMDNAKRSVAGSLVLTSEDGEKGVKGDPYDNFQVIKLRTGESLTGLELPRLPAEMGAVLGILEQDKQQSTLPYPLAYGGPSAFGGQSGVALAIQLEATRSLYNPRTGAMALAYTWLCEELLKQFAQKAIKPSDFRGYKPTEKREYFQETIKPSEIDPRWFVSITVEPRMPRDEYQEVMMALAATQKRGPDDIPLLSKETARENILKLRDPQAEQDKALAEMGMALPPIIAAQIAAALKRRGENELATQVMLLLKPPGAQGGQPPPLPPQLVEALVKTLVQAGAPQLAEALLKALGIGAPQGAPPGPPPGMMGTPAPSGPPASGGPGMVK